MRIVTIVGTRPNFMKVAPLLEQFKKGGMESILVHTGQHYSPKMSHLFFEELGLPKPDEHLVCQTNVDVATQKNFLKLTIETAIEKHKPDLVVVVGDVNSTIAGARAAKHLGIKVAHIEAGLRSFDQSMPEEVNRIETDKISDFLFTTEKSGKENLLKEGICENKIFFVGNVMIDTLLKHKEKAEKSTILEKLDLKEKNYCIATLHRPSNVDTKESLEQTLSILKTIQKKMKVVFPIHPRTQKNIEKFGFKQELLSMSNLKMVEPLGYLDFLKLLSHSKVVFTDSGGIQEETTVLGVPCITYRDNTERPVTVEQGTNMLVSTNHEKIVEAFDSLLALKEISVSLPPLWDGKAAERIASILLRQKT